LLSQHFFESFLKSFLKELRSVLIYILSLFNGSVFTADNYHIYSIATQGLLLCLSLIYSRNIKLKEFVFLHKPQQNISATCCMPCKKRGNAQIAHLVFAHTQANAKKPKELF